jgi:3-oxoadipate enol-lactonase
VVGTMEAAGTAPRRRWRRPEGAPSAASPGWRVLELDGRGLTFAYERAGPPGARTIVLLHGWIATGASNWNGTLGALAEHYHVVALDHRGHGRGIRSGGPFTLEDCADDVVALLDVLGVGSAILVGYSMGGPIAQLTWRRHPERVEALVLYATAADFTDVPIPAPVRQVAGALVSATLAVTRPVTAPLLRSSRRLRTLEPGEDGELDASLVDALAGHDAETVHRALHEIVRYDAGEWIGAVDVPTAVIVTRRDRAVSPHRQRELAASIPGAHVIELDGAHLLPFTDPATTAHALLRAGDLVAPTASRARPGRWRARVGAVWARLRGRRRAGRIA